MAPAQELLASHYPQRTVGGGAAEIKGAGPPCQREQGQAPLRRTSDLPGVREPLRSYDSILAWKPAGGICVPGLSPEREKLFVVPTVSTRKHWTP